eukprot:CAMPEP_0194289354 /NCGR_PEP_ID=MMETSP0169-20130528/38916_1 /TAXON_ID=218684 /ORGANISM="Corethron pennatum, Strain L29A3" /LENGTH=307 /DNA_ID=CAMNT_0039036613 /DNA_START=17 /DNA_END=940 /DNA_ORIENTATION=-
MKDDNNLAKVQAEQHKLFQSFRNNSTDEVSAPKRNESNMGPDMDIFLARLLDIRLNRDVQRNRSNIARDQKIAMQLAQEINADAKPSNDLSKDEELARQLLREDQIKIDSLSSQSGLDTSKDEQLARALDQNFRRSSLSYTSDMHKDAELARRLALDEAKNPREAQGEKFSFSGSEPKSPDETARRSVVNLSKHGDQHFNQGLASSTEMTRHAKALEMKNNSYQKEVVRRAIEVKKDKLSHENINSRVLEMLNRTNRKSGLEATPPGEAADNSDDETAIERVQRSAQKSEESFKDYLLSRRKRSSVP